MKRPSEESRESQSKRGGMEKLGGVKEVAKTGGGRSGDQENGGGERVPR